MFRELIRVVFIWGKVFYLFFGKNNKGGVIWMKIFLEENVEVLVKIIFMFSLLNKL